MTYPGERTLTNSIALLEQRCSVPSRLLGEPAPDEAQLERWLSAAVRVPDHGKLAPWRFLLIRGDARHILGGLLHDTWLKAHPDASEAVLAKERGRFTNAPLIVAVVGRFTEGHKVPVCEQLLSAGCVCYSLLLAAHADGFAAQWLTGWAAYDKSISAALGLAENETFVGFIHIGSARDRLPERERPTLDSLLSEWHG